MRPAHGLSAALAAAGLSGCTFLSAGASLEVDVEVYTGPLSQSDTSQVADAIGAIDSGRYDFRLFLQQLTGTYPSSRVDLTRLCSDFQAALPRVRKQPGSRTLVPTVADSTRANLCSETARAIDMLDRADRELEKRLDGSARLKRVFTKADDRLLELRKADVDAVKGALRTNPADPSADTTLARRELLSTYQDVLRWSPAEAAKKLSEIRIPPELDGRIAGILIDAKNEGIDALEKPSTLGFDHEAVLAAMSFIAHRGTRWPSDHIGEPLRDREVRERVAQFSNIANYYSRLIESRVDLLLKQDEGKVTPERLPTSDYLRDASAAEYLGLYSWHKTGKRDFAGGGRWGSGVWTSADGLNVEDRVRAARLLFADRYWTRINEVFASGRGDVRIALVKDDIGNWSLKSFDNNPEALLNAYRETSIAGLQAASRLAQGGVAPSGGFLRFVGDLTRGKVAASDALAGIDASIGTTREETQREIGRIRAAFVQTAVALDGERTESSGRVVERKAALEQAQRAADETQRELDRIAILREDAVRRDDAARAEELSDESARIEQRLATQRQEAAERQAQLAGSEATLAAVEARRAAAASRAVEASRQELRSHKRAIAAIREISSRQAPREESKPTAPATDGLPVAQPLSLPTTADNQVLP